MNGTPGSDQHCKSYCRECLLFASDTLSVWRNRICRLELYDQGNRATSCHCRALAVLASMAIEKDLLMELQLRDQLYAGVIEFFLCKERKMDFAYKEIITTE